MRTDRKTRTSNTMGMNLGHRQQMFAALGALFIAVSLMQVARAQTPAAQIPPAQASTPAVTPETPPPAAPAASAVPPHTPVTPSVQPSPQAQAPASPPVASPGVPGAAPNPPAPTDAAEPSVTPAPPAGGPSIGGDLLPRQLSYTRMFLDADWIVKTVMIGLAFASLVSWTVWLAKTWELQRVPVMMVHSPNV